MRRNRNNLRLTAEIPSLDYNFKREKASLKGVM